MNKPEAQQDERPGIKVLMSNVKRLEHAQVATKKSAEALDSAKRQYEKNKTKHEQNLKAEKEAEEQVRRVAKQI